MSDQQGNHNQKYKFFLGDVIPDELDEISEVYIPRRIHSTPSLTGTTHNRLATSKSFTNLSRPKRKKGVYQFIKLDLPKEYQGQYTSTFDNTNWNAAEKVREPSTLQLQISPSVDHSLGESKLMRLKSKTNSLHTFGDLPTVASELSENKIKCLIIPELWERHWLNTCSDLSKDILEQVMIIAPQTLPYIEADEDEVTNEFGSEDRKTKYNVEDDIEGTYLERLRISKKERAASSRDVLSKNNEVSSSSIKVKRLRKPVLSYSQLISMLRSVLVQESIQVLYFTSDFAAISSIQLAKEIPSMHFPNINTIFLCIHKYYLYHFFSKFFVGDNHVPFGIANEIPKKNGQNCDLLQNDNIVPSLVIDLSRMDSKARSNIKLMQELKQNCRNEQEREELKYDSVEENKIIDEVLTTIGTQGYLKPCMGHGHALHLLFSNILELKGQLRYMRENIDVQLIKPMQHFLGYQMSKEQRRIYSIFLQPVVLVQPLMCETSPPYWKNCQIEAVITKDRVITLWPIVAHFNLPYYDVHPSLEFPGYSCPADFPPTMRRAIEARCLSDLKKLVTIGMTHCIVTCHYYVRDRKTTKKYEPLMSKSFGSFKKYDDSRPPKTKKEGGILKNINDMLEVREYIFDSTIEERAKKGQDRYDMRLIDIDPHPSRWTRKLYDIACEGNTGSLFLAQIQMSNRLSPVKPVLSGKRAYCMEVVTQDLRVLNELKKSLQIFQYEQPTGNESEEEALEIIKNSEFAHLAMALDYEKLERFPHILCVPPMDKLHLLINRFIGAERFFRSYSKTSHSDEGITKPNEELCSTLGITGPDLDKYYKMIGSNENNHNNNSNDGEESNFVEDSELSEEILFKRNSIIRKRLEKENEASPKTLVFLYSTGRFFAEALNELLMMKHRISLADPSDFP
ncbi:hypothetical protein SNEBB_003248 [Seison nebaliae]|nr:hypothetical protein SNEBB_003248 [Seison nebaliae]